jgi:putative (di)nucleoside polyphosphate hydrolase
VSGAFFRVGVGVVVVDRSSVLVLKRRNVSDHHWQLPQGGLGMDESPLDGMYRELEEETGVARRDVELLRSTDSWWAYELPLEYRNAKVGWGQVQQWFLCRLTAPRQRVQPDQVEFSEADWVSAEQLLVRAVPFRVPTYRRLVQEFGL